MKSQNDPKIELKNSVAFPAAIAIPDDCMSHATEYPSGVFQLNGHLQQNKEIF